MATTISDYHNAHPRHWRTLYDRVNRRMDMADEQVAQDYRAGCHYCRTLMPGTTLSDMEPWVFTGKADPVMGDGLCQVIASKDGALRDHRPVIRAMPGVFLGEVLSFLAVTQRRAAPTWRLETPAECKIGVDDLVRLSEDFAPDDQALAAAMVICMRVAVLQRAITQRDGGDFWDDEENDWVRDEDLLPPVSVEWATVSQSLAEQPEWLTLP